MDQPLAVRAEHQRGHTIVTVAGDIDSTTAPQLRECLHKLAACGRYQIRRLFLLAALHYQIPLSHTVAEALAALPHEKGTSGAAAAATVGGDS